MILTCLVVLAYPFPTCLMFGNVSVTWKAVSMSKRNSIETTRYWFAIYLVAKELCRMSNAYLWRVVGWIWIKNYSSRRVNADLRAVSVEYIALYGARDSWKVHPTVLRNGRDAYLLSDGPSSRSRVLRKHSSTSESLLFRFCNSVVNFLERPGGPQLFDNKSVKITVPFAYIRRTATVKCVCSSSALSRCPFPGAG